MNLQEQINRIQSMMRTINEEVSEEIDAKEAYSEYESIKTIIDGKRDVAFTELSPITSIMVLLNGLKKMKLPQSGNYVVYRKGAEDKAKELYDIANKYGGYLHYDATEEDSRKIGKLLGYKESDIENYIERNKKIKTNLPEHINRIQSMMGVINEDKQHIDKILDKIIKYGMDSLSDMDREYLGNPSSQELNQLIKKRQDRIESLWSYDPREDTEFFDDLSSEVGHDFDFSKYSDEDIEEGRYSIIYDEIDDDDLIHFMKIFKITDEDMRNEKGQFKGWDYLDNNIQDKFKEFIDELY